MKHNHSHKVLLLFAIAVTIFVAAVYAYMYHMIGVSLDRTRVARESVKTDPLNDNGAQDRLFNYKTNAEKWGRLPGMFFTPDQAVIFIESIEALSKETGSKVALASIDADKLDAAAPGTEGSIRARVNATGSWNSVMQALSLAEVLPYKVSIDNVRIDRYTSSSEGINVKGQKTANGWKLSFDIQAGMVAFASAMINSK
jgi:hypothetical protein